MNESHPAIRMLQVLLAIALLATLILAGSRIYRRLPTQSPTDRTEGPTSQVTIVLSNPAIADNTKLEIFPVDFASLQRDFVANGRSGRSFEEYLTNRLKTISPVRGRFDQNGRAPVQLGAGQWWLRATTAAAGGELTEWRLPLTISRPTTIELSADNAYERTKQF